MIKLPYGILAAFFTCSILFLCVLANDAGTLLFLPKETPKEVSDTFFTACTNSDSRTTLELSPQAVDLFPSFTTENEQSSILFDSLRESYSYSYQKESISGSVGSYSTKAEETAEFTSLSIPKLVPDVLGKVNSELADLVENSKKSDVYDENDNYRTDVLETIYQNALEETLKKSDKYYTTTQVTLNLSYEDGSWLVTPDGALKNALSGGVPSGADLSNYLKSEVLGELTYIPKTYTIAEGATQGPVPNADKYGKASGPAEIAALPSKFPRLTEGKESFFNPDAVFVDQDFYYYGDDTILTYTWREILFNHTCTFAEVYVADPSQFRRKLSGDTYGSPIQKYASQMAKETNSVIAMNGDFYKFRAEGMTVYDRTLYRFNPYKLELCHVDSKGNLNFTYAGELKTSEDAEKYIKDNDILFTLAFGPVLVANGEAHVSDPNYLLGQVGTRYSRSVICQGEANHYLLLTINHNYNPRTTTVTIPETLEILMEKKVKNAYVLDGGQTAEIIMQDRVSNHIDFNTERTVSDILYFCTALPEDENN